MPLASAMSTIPHQRKLPWICAFRWAVVPLRLMHASMRNLLVRKREFPWISSFRWAVAPLEVTVALAMNRQLVEKLDLRHRIIHAH